MERREWWTRTALVALSVFNLIDAGATYYLLARDLGYEINPLVAALYRVSPEMFLVAKVAVFLFVLIPLWLETHVPRVQYVIWTAAIGYGILSLYYIALLWSLL